MHWLRTSLATRGRAVVVDVHIIRRFVVVDDGVAEHEAGVSASAVRPELDDEDGRAADERVWGRLVAAHGRRQRRVGGAVEQLDVVAGAVRRPLNRQAVYVHFEHLQTASQSISRSVSQLTKWPAWQGPLFRCSASYAS